jgi:hypothetical protein
MPSTRKMQAIFAERRREKTEGNFDRQIYLNINVSEIGERKSLVEENVPL